MHRDGVEVVRLVSTHVRSQSQQWRSLAAESVAVKEIGTAARRVERKGKRQAPSTRAWCKAVERVALGLGRVVLCCLFVCLCVGACVCVVIV